MSKKITITEMCELLRYPQVSGDPNRLVRFSDGKDYWAILIQRDGGWDCSLRPLSSPRLHTSPMRRRMVVEHLGLPSAVERQESSRWRLRREQLRKKYGLALHKSRTRYTHDDDRGGYKVTDRSGNVVIGERFDATIEDVEELLQKKANEFRSVYAVDVPAEKMDADTVSVDWEE